MTPRRFQAIGSPEACAAVQAHQAKRVTGIQAVFDRKDGQPKQRSCRCWSLQVVQCVIINHFALHESLHFGAGEANRALMRPALLSDYIARGISRETQDGETT
ncbi:hypothetical protein GCM10011363_07900 [Marivita lacus]|uniref:Uncharacterized protein n=1 Tax=Marivita lacus TaxID=1323742 RepID=A0ABQ1KCE3_9RHOB|nr:hypothetical protein GCM10011363_07900 [Marivita lacus]